LGGVDHVEERREFTIELAHVCKGDVEDAVAVLGGTRKVVERAVGHGEFLDGLQLEGGEDYCLDYYCGCCQPEGHVRSRFGHGVYVQM